MVNARVTGAVVLAAVFALGAVAGGGGAYAWLRRDEAAGFVGDRPGVRDPRRLRALERELDLTPAQRERVRAVLDRSGEQRRVLAQQMFERCGADVQAQRDAVSAEIRALLTPEQQPRFDALTARQRERFPFGMGPPGGRGRGPRGREGF